MRRYSPGRWAFNLLTPVVLLLLIVLISNSLVLSARLAIPGDPLYPTKLVLEDAQVFLTPRQVDRTALYIRFSHERTTELVEIVLEGKFDLLPVAAARMETEIIASLHAIEAVPLQDQAAAQSMAFELKETLSNEISMLNVLKSTSPPSAHQGIELAIQDARSAMMALH